jgi:hypothetical protein
VHSVDAEERQPRRGDGPNHLNVVVALEGQNLSTSVHLLVWLLLLKFLTVPPKHFRSDLQR